MNACVSRRSLLVVFPKMLEPYVFTFSLLLFALVCHPSMKLISFPKNPSTSDLFFEMLDGGLTYV